jgi:hypothetical protein
MDFFDIEYKIRNDENLAEKANRKCLQIAKESIYFKLYLHNLNCTNNLSKSESFYVVVNIVENIIKEFNMDVEFKYSFEDKYFEFNQPQKNVELYICLIFARFLYSDESVYENIIDRMYKLKDKYSTFESYMIASCDNHYGYYSIQEKCILSIEKYRKIENKKNFFTFNLNNDIEGKLTVFKYDVFSKYNIMSKATIEELEAYYFQKLEEFKNIKLIFYTVQGRKVNQDFYAQNYFNALNCKAYSFLYITKANRRQYKVAPVFIEREELIKLIPLTKKGELKKGNKEYKILKAHEQFTN